MLAGYSLWGLLWGLLCLGLCASRLFLAPRPLGWAALACGVHASLLLLPTWPVVAFLLGLHPPGSWFGPPQDPVNWLSKSAALAASLAWVYAGRRPTPDAAGLRAPAPGAWRLVGPVVLAVAVWVAVSANYEPHLPPPGMWSHYLFYGLMPGLEEEVFYRGVLVGLLAPVFARTLPLFGARTSWGGVVGVLLFVLAHHLAVPERLFGLGMGADLERYVRAWLSPAHFPPGAVLYELGMGTLFLWVRERTGSCWAAVAAHCLMNGCLDLGRALP
jgi:membrane protease YdiL (CAAX protease family)